VASSELEIKQLQEQLRVASSKLPKEQLKEPEEERSTQPKQVQQLVVSSEKKETFQEKVPALPNPQMNIAITKPVEELPKTHVKPISYQVEAVDGVSDDLLTRFQAAIDDTGSSTNEIEDEQTQTVNSEIKSLTQMPTWVQEGVPSLRFEQHIYASDGEGWVNVNGRDRYEGDSVANGVVIDKILPQQVILTYRGEKFSLPALTNW